MSCKHKWHAYKTGDKPTKYKLYIVSVDDSIGGIEHIYLAQYRKDQTGLDVFSSHGTTFIPDIDKAVIYWYEFPDLEKI